jgi:dTDP-4-amino-4,6-dideoxygalactose transaminase
MDPVAVEKAITPRTKAIVPVHLYGQAAEMETIMDIARRHGLYVIEDNAQAIGCDYRFSNGTVKKTGTIGHIGCTSFYPSKNLGAFGDGGAIFTDDDALANRLKMIAIHGQSKRYYHDVVGCNSRLDAIQAAILSIKLRHLDAYITARREAAAVYDAAFAGESSITVPYRSASSRHVFHQYTLTLEGVNRDALHAYLAEKGVPSMIYYPVPCHRQQMFAAFGGNRCNLPVTDMLTGKVISLPMHTELDAEQQAFIADQVKQFVHQP